jgi:hypothetical protein
VIAAEAPKLWVGKQVVDAQSLHLAPANGLEVPRYEAGRDVGACLQGGDEGSLSKRRRATHRGGSTWDLRPCETSAIGALIWVWTGCGVAQRRA